jgi:hypothetical protein
MGLSKIVIMPILLVGNSNGLGDSGGAVWLGFPLDSELDSVDVLALQATNPKVRAVTLGCSSIKSDFVSTTA